MSDLLSGLIPEAEKKIPDGVLLDFKVDRAALDKALNSASSVVASKDLLPILKNFHFTVSDFDLRITASDSLHSVLIHTPVHIADQEGEAVFPATKILSVVREASAEQVHVKVKVAKGKPVATIKSGTTAWTIPLADHRSFPDLTDYESMGTVEVDREPFLTALGRVRKAASTDPMRPYLMMVDVRNGKMRASDAIRFQQVKFAFPFDCEIPIRAVPEIVSRLSASKSEKVEAGITDTALLFRIDKSLLVVQRVNAEFPDVDEVLLKPTLSNDQTLKVNRASLLNAIKRVRITADELTAAVVLSLNVGSVSVESKDRKGGTAVETVVAEWNHPPRHVSFNHQHLSDMLSSTKSEQCSFRLGKDLKTRPTPLLMEDTDEGFVAVLSQIRLDWL